MASIFIFYIIVQVEEVYSFSQDDLLTEDILILDTHAEVFIWVGQSVDSKEKQSAFEIGQVLHNCLGVCHIFPFIMFSVTECYFFYFLLQKYIEMAASMEGLSLNVPLYKVTEGNEPCFFTTYFSWDNNKAIVCGETIDLFFWFSINFYPFSYFLTNN